MEGVQPLADATDQLSEAAPQTSSPQQQGHPGDASGEPTAHEADFKRIVDQFQQFDVHGNGTMDRVELKQVLKRLDPSAWTEVNVDRLLASLDENADSLINVQEFLSWACRPSLKKVSGAHGIKRLGSKDALGRRRPSQGDGVYEYDKDRDHPLTRALGTHPSASTRRITDLYELSDEIATGQYATVVKARQIATGAECVAKVVVKDALARLKRRRPDARLELREKDVAPHVGRPQQVGMLPCPSGKPTLLEVAMNVCVKTSHKRYGAVARVTVEVDLRREGKIISNAHAFNVGTSIDKPRDSGSRCFNSHEAIVWKAKPGDEYVFRLKLIEGRDEIQSLCLEQFVANITSGRLAQEIALMREIDHPNCVRLWDAFEDDRSIYLCMEACGGKDMLQAIIDAGCFTERQASALMRQAFSATYYLHGLHVMHRDLKLENMMLLRGGDIPMEENVLKIIDFGSARNFPSSGNTCSTKVGSPYFIAPEVIRESYSHACDMWSLGVACFILLSGKPPFDHEEDAGIWMQVLRGGYSLEGEEWTNISDDAKALVQGCLTMDVPARLTAAQVITLRWFKQAAPNRRMSHETFANLKLFWAGGRVRKLSCVLLSRHLDTATVKRLNEEWATLDQDDSGFLTPDELQDGLMKAGLGLGTGKHGWQTWLTDNFGRVSIKGPRINYSTFLAAAMDRRTLSDEDACYAAFCSCDVDGNGEVSRQELATVLRDTGLADTIGQDKLDAATRGMDLDSSGTIEFNEFLAALRHADLLA